VSTSRRVALALLLALTAPACSIQHVTSGPALPAADGLRPGHTTKAEALEQLGAPNVVRRQHDGDLFVWRRTDSYTTLLRLVPYLVLYERTRGALDLDQLALLFDHDGVLAGVGETRDIDD